MSRAWIVAAVGATGVGAGAFGAHGLALLHVSAARIETWQTAAHYHQLHAVVLLMLWLGTAPESSRWAWRLLLAGIAVFAGSLYLLVLLDQPWLGAVTPIGGVLLIAGWLSLASLVPKTVHAGNE